MSIRLVIAAATACASLLCGLPDAPAAEGAASITFRGSSTLHAFSGGVTTRSVTVETAISGTTWVWKASGSLAVTNMTTAHAGRDAKMFKMLSATKWPQITAAVVDPTPVTASATGCTVRVVIAGATNDLSAAVENASLTGDHFAATLRLPLSLKAFKLVPPSVLGMIRVADRIEVTCHLDAGTAANP